MMANVVELFERRDDLNNQINAVLLERINHVVDFVNKGVFVAFSNKVNIVNQLDSFERFVLECSIGGELLEVEVYIDDFNRESCEHFVASMFLEYFYNAFIDLEVFQEMFNKYLNSISVKGD